MSFHHLDGFFCFTVLVSSENCFMFGINARLDGGFLAVLVGKNGNAAFEAFGRLGESGIVAIAVEDQVKIIGAVVPGFMSPHFAASRPLAKIEVTSAFSFSPHLIFCVKISSRRI